MTPCIITTFASNLVESVLYDNFDNLNLDIRRIKKKYDVCELLRKQINHIKFHADYREQDNLVKDLFGDYCELHNSVLDYLC